LSHYPLTCSPGVLTAWVQAVEKRAKEKARFPHGVWPDLFLLAPYARDVGDITLRAVFDDLHALPFIEMNDCHFT
jgi:hypothetical protein